MRGVILYLLKNVLENRKDFKLIIMSATINRDIFRDEKLRAYFDYLMLWEGTNIKNNGMVNRKG